MNSRVVLKPCLDSSRHALLDAKDSGSQPVSFIHPKVKSTLDLKCAMAGFFVLKIDHGLFRVIGLKCAKKPRCDTRI